MKEEIKLNVVLAQKSRHTVTVESCGREQRRKSPAERDHVWMGAVVKDMLHIMYVTSIAQITSRGGIMSPGYCFNS